MKKLLVLALVASLANAEDTRFVAATRNAAGKTAEIIQTPFIVVKDAVNAVTDKDGDVRDVLGQFGAVPGQVYEDAKDVALAVKDATVTAGTKIKDATVTAATKVKDTTVKVGRSIKSGANTVKTKTKDFFHSEAIQDIQDVGTQLFVDAPTQVAEGVADTSRAVWGKIAAIFKAVKSELF